MENPFEEFNRKLDETNKRLEAIEKKLVPAAPTRIPFSDFLKEKDISRPTGYAWRDRGIIKLEKIGGRQFVLSDSIIVTNKYQREPA